MSEKESINVTAKELKNELWATLKEVRAGKVDAHVASAIAILGHGILRTVKLELDISQSSSISQEIADFTGTQLLENDLGEENE